MATIDAHKAGDARGDWRISWVAVVDGCRIQGVKFATKAEALAYARRVADYQATAIVHKAAACSRS